MPLGGILALPPEACIAASALSVPVITAGLVTFRACNPSVDIRASSLRLIGRPGAVILGFILTFCGLVLGCLPMLPGNATDADVRQAHLLQCFLLPSCWFAERFVLQRRPLPVQQTFHCFWVFVASVIYRYGEPRPFDNAELDSEVSGCDGGYRFWFRVYVCIFTTLCVFGILLVFPTDEGLRQRFASLQSDDDSDSPAEQQDPGPLPSSLRRKLFPFLYGGAVSAATILFAVGAASDRQASVKLGCGLLAVAVVLAWEWLYRQELTLASWAPASQMFVNFVGYLQAICVFQDMQWAPEDEHGFFSVQIIPGCWFMAVAVLMFSITYPVFLQADDSVEWGSAAVDDGPDSGRDAREFDRRKTMVAMVHARRPARVLICILLPACLATVYLGLTVPMMVTHVDAPKVLIVQDNDLPKTTAPPTTTTTVSTLPGQAPQGGPAFINVIPNSYRGKMPISALSVIWLGFRYPAMLVMHTFVVVLRPAWVPPPFQKWSRNEIVNGASARFINPMINMLAISWLNYWDPGNGSVRITFGGGFWYLVIHACLCVSLALAVEVDSDKLDRLDREDGTQRIMNKGEDSESEWSEDSDTPTCDPVSLGSLGIVALSCLVGGAMYVGITNPFIFIQVRVEGVITSRFGPNLLDLWHSLEEASGTVGTIAASTVLFAMLVWVPVLLMTLRCSTSKWARISEKTVRQWVMGHHWMTALIMLYIILSIRSGNSKALIEACYEFPDPPIGPLAILVMGISVQILTNLAKKLVSAPQPDTPQPQQPGGIKIPNLPGGKVLWLGGVGAIFATCFYVLIISAPEHQMRLENLDDVNEQLGSAVQLVNENLKNRVPEALGDCEGLREHRLKLGITEYMNATCRGNKPLANKSHDGFLFSARWITGLNTIKVTRMEVLPPKDFNAAAQRWNFVIDGELTNLHVWLKVVLGTSAFGTGPWIDDNMCCNNPFHFTMQASAVCEAGKGFSPMAMDIPHLDPLEFKHTVNEGEKGSYEANYGSYDVVEKALRKIFRAQVSHVRVQMGDGTITNPMEYISDMMEKVLVLNTGHHCPKGTKFTR